MKTKVYTSTKTAVAWMILGGIAALAASFAIGGGEVGGGARGMAKVGRACNEASDEYCRPPATTGQSCAPKKDWGPNNTISGICKGTGLGNGPVKCDCAM